MRKAFTLLELLMVVAIIAVVVALAFPVLSRTRERAKRTHCINNLKQLGTAIETYSQDYDGKYPYAWYSEYVVNGWGSPSISQALGQYVRDESLWKCPSDIGETFPNGSFGWHTKTPPIWRICISSYGWMGFGLDPYSRVLAGKPVTSFKQPSASPMLVEVRPWHGVYKRDDAYQLCPGLYNVLYCDGHVGQRTGRQWNDDQADAFGYPRLWGP